MGQHTNIIQKLENSFYSLDLADKAEAADAIKKLEGALLEVMNWVNNWDAPFLDDDEWPDTVQRVETALGR